MPTLQDIYLSYLDCLNRQAFDELGTFVVDNVEHNGCPFGLRHAGKGLCRNSRPAV
ncbi:hypothetical protein At15955_26630 [Agrobacterium tumefaciens]|nr:hypothetical protein At15955_26630 [Agrobacterium tumefaciens]AYM68947.1 hypothetical protein AtA6_27310 [Agrobacterium tumefaciens]CUW97008.1 hypothetical protein AGR1C_Lc10018 [Agrobacterium fabacearum TT111]